MGAAGLKIFSTHWAVSSLDRGLTIRAGCSEVGPIEQKDLTFIRNELSAAYPTIWVTGNRSCRAVQSANYKPTAPDCEIATVAARLENLLGRVSSPA